MAPVIKNWQFCDGCHFQDNIPQIQVPNDWYLKYTDHQPIPEVTPPVEGLRPESVCASIWDVGGEWGKFGTSQPNPSGYNTVFKIHKGFAPFSFELEQDVEVTLGKKYTVYAYIFPDFYNENKEFPEPYTAAAGISINGTVKKWNWPLEFDTWQIITQEFTATSNKVTLGICGFSKWGLAGNTFWIHGMRIEESGVAPEPEPEPSTGRGKPRVQYERTYILLHVDEPQAMKLQASKTVSSIGRADTIGFSADDAGIGDLDYRRIIAVNPAMWEGESNLDSFYATYYPGVILTKVYATTAPDLDRELRRAFTEESEVPLTVTPFSQNDPRWKDTVYSGTATFGKYGCLVTSIAMLLGEEPPIVAEKLRNVGAFNGAMLSKPERIPLAYPKTSWGGTTHWRADIADINVIKQEIKTSGAAICEVHWDPTKPPIPDNQHFVVVQAISENDAILVDPWNGEQKSLSTSRYVNAGENILAALTGIRKLRTVTNTPGSNPGKLISLHLQTFIDADLEWIGRSKPNVVKFLNSAGGAAAAAAIKSVSSDTKVVYRHHINNEDIGKIVTDPQTWTDWAFDQIPQDIFQAVELGNIDYVETFCNEANQWFTTAQWAAADRYFVKRLAVRMPKARPVTMTLSVGHPWNEGDYATLIPLARETAARSGAGGYHGYFGVVDGKVLPNWEPWHELRFERLDRVFREAGVTLPWIITEGGACVMTPDGYFDSGAGWRDSRAYNNDFEAYKRQLDLLEARLRKSTAKVLGYTLFTVNAGETEWEKFTLKPADLERL